MLNEKVKKYIISKGIDFDNQRPNHNEDYLITVRNGHCFGFSDYTYKIYSNLIVHDGGSKPTEKQCTDGLKALQDAWDAANGG